MSNLSHVCVVPTDHNLANEDSRQGDKISLFRQHGTRATRDHRYGIILSVETTGTKNRRFFIQLTPLLPSVFSPVVLLRHDFSS